MSAEKCYAPLEEILARPLTKNERNRVKGLVSRLRGDDTASWQTPQVKAEIENMVNDTVTEGLRKLRNEYLNRDKVTTLYNSIFSLTKDAEGNLTTTPLAALEAMLTGQQSTRFGTRYNIGRAMEGMVSEHENRLLNNLMEIDPDLPRVMRNGEKDVEIRRALYRLDAGESLEGIDPIAAQAAKVIRNHFEAMRIRANNAGANIAFRQGWAGTQTHNAYKIRKADREEYIQFMVDNVDLAKLFPDADPADYRGLLKKLYGEFVSGSHIKAASEGTAGLTGTRNLGRQLSHERKIVFKTPEAEQAYAMQYGDGHLIDTIAGSTRSMARNITLMEMMGPNADHTLNVVLDKLMDDVNRTGDAKMANKARADMNRIRNEVWPTVTGASEIPHSHAAASIGRGLRAWQSLTSLGFAVMSAVSDIPIAASAYRWQGDNMFTGIGKQVAALFKNLDAPSRREAAAALGMELSRTQTLIASRLSHEEGYYGAVAKAMDTYFRWNLLSPWTDKQLYSMQLSTAAGITAHRAASYGQIPPAWQRILHQAGIDQHHWDAVRKSQTFHVEADNVDLIVPENIGKLDDEVIATMLQRQNPDHKVTPRRIYDARRDLENRWRTMIVDQATQGVVMPGVKARATMFRGTAPGTVTGELLRSIGQFKAFPVAVLQGPMARELYATGNKVDAIKGIANLIVWSAVGGYLGMNLKELAKGREPRPMDSWEVFVAAMAQGGGLGIYGDFLFGDMKNRFGGNAISTLAGPVAGDINSLVDLAQRLRDGDDVAAATLRALYANMPFNMFYTKAVLDYTILFQLQEAINPGYLRRMENRLEKDYDQQYIYSPSQVIP